MTDCHIRHSYMLTFSIRIKTYFHRDKKQRSESLNIISADIKIIIAMIIILLAMIIIIIAMKIIIIATKIRIFAITATDICRADSDTLYESILIIMASSRFIHKKVVDLHDINLFSEQTKYHLYEQKDSCYICHSGIWLHCLQRR